MAFKFPNGLRGPKFLFLLFVAAPTLIAIVYFGLLASDVYVSESKFVVRSPEKPAATGLGAALIGATGLSGASDESFSAKAYVESRDALRSINKNEAFRKAYDSDNIWVGERFGSLGFNDSFEVLYKYYLTKVKVETDVPSSISTLTVRAYSAKAAHSINEQILRRAEGTINRMNERSRADLVKFALAEVEDAKDQSRRAGAALANFRNRYGVVDPEIQAAAKLEMISKLQDQLITARTQLNQLRRFAPKNPQIPAVETQIETITEEIAAQTSTLTGSNKSLAANTAEYQRLFVENEFTDKQLTVALASLQEARNDARRQQVYVQRIAQPNLPDSPIEPRRLRAILATFALGLVAWGIASMLVAGIKEHAQ
jgi:capsular polysaccharide transport system permease protein